MGLSGLPRGNEPLSNAGLTQEGRDIGRYYLSIGPPPLRPEKRPVFSMKNIDNSFWRDKAVGMLNVKAHSINGAIIHSQGLWDRYRQYIKEKYNE